MATNSADSEFKLNQVSYFRVVEGGVVHILGLYLMELDDVYVCELVCCNKHKINQSLSNEYSF